MCCKNYMGLRMFPIVNMSYLDGSLTLIRWGLILTGLSTDIKSQHSSFDCLLVFDDFPTDVVLFTVVGIYTLICPFLSPHYRCTRNSFPS